MQQEVVMQSTSDHELLRRSFGAMTGKAPPNSPTHWIEEHTMTIGNTLPFLLLCSFCFLLECISWSEDMMSKAVAATL